jgi:septal ring factor EnvC (AmiA/AmiB activator)
MTTVKEKTTTRTNEFIEQAQRQVKDWLDHFNRLEGAMKDAGDGIDRLYHERIVDLKGNLDEVNERLDDLRSSNQDDWNQRRYRFQQASSNYQHSYTTLIHDLKEDKRVSSGWLEGFTKETPAGLFGWLEEMVENIPKSEGGKAVYSQN